MLYAFSGFQTYNVFFNHIHDWQVFVTCCDPEPLRRMEGGVEFHMKQGVLEA